VHAIFKKPRVSGVSSTGAWSIPQNYSYFLDTGLALQLAELFQGSTVIEFGAGTGHYNRFLTTLRKNITIRSFDGVKNIEQITEGLVRSADLTEVINQAPADWVFCSEVGEHVPVEFVNTLLGNIVRHAKVGVVLTWALPGQPGVGHVNCLPTASVKNLMSRRGFCLMPCTSQLTRAAANGKHFRKTAMVFVKCAGAGRSGLVTSFDKLLCNVLNVNHLEVCSFQYYKSWKAMNL